MLRSEVFFSYILMYIIRCINLDTFIRTIRSISINWGVSNINPVVRFSSKEGNRNTCVHFWIIEHLKCTHSTCRCTYICIIHYIIAMICKRNPSINCLGINPVARLGAKTERAVIYFGHQHTHDLHSSTQTLTRNFFSFFL